MCAALEVSLDSGHTLLVADVADPLSWEREEHQGWGVGLYPPDQAHSDGECLAFGSTDDGSPEALVPLVGAVLEAYTRRRQPSASRPGAPGRPRLPVLIHVPV